MFVACAYAPLSLPMELLPAFRTRYGPKATAFTACLSAHHAGAVAGVACHLTRVPAFRATLKFRGLFLLLHRYLLH